MIVFVFIFIFEFNFIFSEEKNYIFHYLIDKFIHLLWFFFAVSSGTYTTESTGQFSEHTHTYRFDWHKFKTSVQYIRAFLCVCVCCWFVQRVSFNDSWSCVCVFKCMKYVCIRACPLPIFCLVLFCFVSNIEFSWILFFSYHFFFRF